MGERAHGLRRGWLIAAGLAAVAAFALLAGRFWHPHYGFTRFVQLDEADARSGIQEIRTHPVFTYEGFNGYDGAAYTQIAFYPLLDSPELQPALGNVPYRARRILGSALAWLIALGEPARIGNTYAALNLGVWLALALLLWRVLPVTDARSFVAWAAVLFSAGALHSVRLALTDLLAATLIVAGIALHERGRTWPAIVALAGAGLARETALAAAVVLWRGPWLSPRAWLGNAARTLPVALPLFTWIAYVRWKAGPAPQGFGNFTWPVVGWLEKWGESFRAIEGETHFRWLAITTLLAVVALTVQAAYLLRHRRLDDSAWRVGATGVAMMTLLGTSVWEGHPGAATRVLLPMSAVFAVLATRDRASWSWHIFGSLSVFSGIMALWTVPPAALELAAGRFDAGSYTVRIADGWFGIERDQRNVWAWTGQAAVLTMDTAPRIRRPVTVELKLRAITPRPLEIHTGGQRVWQGTLPEKVETIAFPATTSDDGQLTLRFSSPAAPIRENTHPDARALGFAVYRARLK